MMWKFRPDVFDRSRPDQLFIDCPAGTDIVAAGEQNGFPVLWGLVPDRSAPTVRRAVAFRNTGARVPPGSKYVATLQYELQELGGYDVRHVFVGPE